MISSMSVQVNKKKESLGKLAAILVRGSNVLVVEPFDKSNKETILKTLETAKFDFQMTVEENQIVIQIGSIPKELKKEIVDKIKKIKENAKQDYSNVFKELNGEIKKLEKIISKDEVLSINNAIKKKIEQYQNK